MCTGRRKPNASRTKPTCFGQILLHEAHDDHSETCRDEALKSLGDLVRRSEEVVGFSPSVRTEVGANMLRGFCARLVAVTLQVERRVQAHWAEVGDVPAGCASGIADLAEVRSKAVDVGYCRDPAVSVASRTPQGPLMTPPTQ